MSVISHIRCYELLYNEHGIYVIDRTTGHAVMATIRLIIIDDNPDIHDTIQRLIKPETDISLVGQAYDGKSGLQLCQLAKPDLVLMDVVMPEMNGAETTATILKHLPATKILALSSFREHEHIRKMLDSGAIGYLVKDGLVQDLITTMRSTMQGNTVLSPEVAEVIFKPDDQIIQFTLTERELQVLQLMAQGLTYSGIAQKLKISSATVRFHVNNVLEKMEVETRSEALVIAAKHNII